MLTRLKPATSAPSGLFFGAGRPVASVSQLQQAKPHHHSPVCSITPKNSINNSNSSNDSYFSSPVRADPRPSSDPSPPVTHSEDAAPEPRPRTPLNPLAREFIPFFLTPSSSLDLDDAVSDLDFVGDPALADHDEHLQQQFVNEVLWSKFHDSDDYAKPPESCSCHDKPLGSCPQVKQQYVSRISRGLNAFGITPNMDGLREPLVSPSFPVEVWDEALRDYFDRPEIVKGMRYGWDVSFTAVPHPKNARCNLQGASLFANDVQVYVDQELKFGALVGPFEEKDLPFQVYCSPVNTVRKKNSEVRRTVVDCSQLDQGINSYIDAHLHRGTHWKLSLPTSQDIIRLIQSARQRYPGQSILIWKIDFARWYRWFILDPVASIFFAIRWRGKIFLDRALSFGNRAAALAAQRVIWAVVYLFRTKVPPFPGSYNSGISCSCSFHCQCGDNLAVGYIDDFIAISGEAVAQVQFESALELAKSLGLRLSQTPGHISPPSTECECLGILYDTHANTMRLPQDKVADLTAILLSWSTKTRATEHELAVLCGKLLYACGVIFAGRLFLNRCLATKRFASTLRQPTILTSDFFADISWWQEAIQLRNGVSFLVPEADVHVSLDASSNGWKDGAPGLGGYNHDNHQFFSTTPPRHLSQLSIADLELLAHIVALHIWGDLWKNKHVTIHTDNQACWHLLRNGRSREDLRLRMSRWISTKQIRDEFRLTSEWIPTSENTLADALSRADDPKQRKLFRDHCHRLGEAPVECHVRAEHFIFE